MSFFFKVLPLAKVLISQPSSAGEVALRPRVGSWSRREVYSIVAALVLVCLTVLAGRATQSVARGSAEHLPTTILAPVKRANLEVTVTEDGEIESSKNLDIKSRLTYSAAILWIVEDGKIVEKGDLLVKLDDAKLHDKLEIQEIVCEKAQALKVQAEKAYIAAAIAVEEYERGVALKEEQIADTQVFVAERNLERAQTLLDEIRKMYRKGFVTPLQRQAQEFAVKQATRELDGAKMAKSVLEKFTKPRQLAQLETLRDTANAVRKAEVANFNLEASLLARIQRRIKDAVVRAPYSGMVIHANESSGHSGMGTLLIAEGAMVHEQQTMLRLPDLNHMQVRVAVHESKVDRIRPGMTARVHVRDRELPGKVVAIANQPEPGPWYMPKSSKEYMTTVELEGEVDGLKPGMTAAVEILVADVENALTVPVEAVVEQDHEFYCWVQTPEGPDRRPLLLGDSNDQVLEVKGGLSEGDSVVLNPSALLADSSR